jgi:hypothetical protein
MSCGRYSRIGAGQVTSRRRSTHLSGKHALAWLQRREPLAEMQQG